MSEIYKKGYLKFDLYKFDPKQNLKDEFLFKTEKEKNQAIENFSSGFCLYFKKGTEFVCYLDRGEELWCDNVSQDIIDMDRYWAAEHLENITLVSGEKEPSFQYQYNAKIYSQLLGLFAWNDNLNWYNGK